MSVKLSPSQKKVVDHFPHFLMDEDATEMTIAGFAGSGKTFLVSYLAQINEKIQKFARMVDDETPVRRLYFTALTNKAAAVLEEMLGVEARTIHSLLGLRVRNNYRNGKQELVERRDGQRENLHNSIIFIDESSMINRDLLLTIRKTQKAWRDCKVVFIGDEYQLPPIKEDVCPVFKDAEHTVRLNEIQRQVQDNPIIQLSARFRECLDDHELPWPEIQEDGKHIITYDNKHEFFEVIKDAYTQDHGRNDYKILAWTNPRVIEYNQWIRRIQGLPETLQSGELVVTNKPLMNSDQKILSQTDTVLRIRQVWPHMEEGIKGHMVRLEGFGTDFFQPWDWREANELVKQYRKDAQRTRDWDPFFIIKLQWADLRPIHASTVHKAQGSTYREVFVDLNNIGRNNHWREVARLTYVAITRASHRVHIFGSLKDRYNRGPVVDLMEPFKNVDCLTT